MSGIIIVGIGGTGSRVSLLQCLRRAMERRTRTTRILVIRPQRRIRLDGIFMDELAHLEALDIVCTRLTLVDQTQKNLFDFMKRRCFSRMFLADRAEMGKVALPQLSAGKTASSYHLTGIRAFEKPEISTGEVCHKKEDSVPYGRDTAKNPGNELSKLSLFLAVVLWRDRRHRRRCRPVSRVYLENRIALRGYLRTLRLRCYHMRRGCMMG